MSIPALTPHKRRPPRVWSFDDDEERRRAAKRETNEAYRQRNRERILARQREKYAKSREIAREKA